MDTYGETDASYMDNYRLLLKWTDEAPRKRNWIGIIGKYDYMPDIPGLTEQVLDHMSYDGTIMTPIPTLRMGNLFFAHSSDTLFKYIDEVSLTDPLVFFFAHSYYMGLKLRRTPPHSEDGPKRIFSPTNIEVHQLSAHEDHYWVSTGPNDLKDVRANFAIYDPGQKTVTLQTLV